MANTKTKQGLSVTVDIIDKLYRTGRQVVNGLKQNMKTAFDITSLNGNTPLFLRPKKT